MEIDLAGAVVALDGPTNAVVDAVLAALKTNGGEIADVASTSGADLLLASCPLLPDEALGDMSARFSAWHEAAAAMAARGGGRIVFLMSACAALPMRRHPRFSMEQASILAGMRGLAMEFGPKVLVNAVGVGLIEDGSQVAAGDPAMLSHAAVGRAGGIGEAVAAVLFFCDPANTYTTGQMLGVDGGWAAGYGRNF